MATVVFPMRVGRASVRFARYADEPVLNAIDRAAQAGPNAHRRELRTWFIHTHLRTVGGKAQGYLVDRIQQADDLSVICRLVTRPGPHSLDTERALLTAVLEPGFTEAEGFELWKGEARFAIPIAQESRTSDVLTLARTRAPAWMLADGLQEAGESRPWLLRALRYGDELAERLARAVGLGLEV